MMRKAARIISLLMAVLMLTSVGWWPGAAAQEPGSLEEEMTVQDTATEEAAELEAAEQAAKESVEREADEKETKVAARREDVEQSAEEGAGQAAEEEKEEVGGEEKTEQPAEETVAEEKTNQSLDETEKLIVTEPLKENVEQGTDDKPESTLFTAEIEIELVNAGDVRLGDMLKLVAKVTCENRSYAIAWQNRKLPSPANEGPEWEEIETGETVQLILTEEAAELEYRVLLTTDNGETAASSEYRLPEPVREEKLADEPKEIGVEPAETTQPESEKTETVNPDAEKPEKEQPGEPDVDAKYQEEEPLTEIEIDSDLNQNNEEEDNLEQVQCEIIVVTEIVPMTEKVSEIPEIKVEESESPDVNADSREVPGKNCEEPEAADENSENTVISDGNSEESGPSHGNTGEPKALDEDNEEPEVNDTNTEESELPDENGEEPEAPDENNAEPESDDLNDLNDEESESSVGSSVEPEAPDEDGGAPALPEKVEPRKERKARILSSLGTTIVSGETIHMALDLSDFEDCANVDVVWEADKGGGWEEAGTGETFDYIATAESIGWVIRARVSYTL